MGAKKWGESFLKTGLPLEHLTLVTFRSLGWSCRTHMEYSRVNRDKIETWFELDLSATLPKPNKDTSFSFLVECKYHDLSRFWFFLPHTVERWPFNERVLNCGPLQSLEDPRKESILKLAPSSVWGIVVSEDGQKQENAVHTAIQQLANGFVPYCMEQFSYNLDFYNYEGDLRKFMPNITAVVPMIVTNASIFRLKPSVSDLDAIRKASSPEVIAEEVEWTWCYYEPSNELINTNIKHIESRIKKEAELFYRFPYVENHISSFIDRPNWIVVANIKYLAKAIKIISKHFLSLETLEIKDLLKGKTSKSKQKAI